MKLKLIQEYGMTLVAETKWNEVWESEEYVMVWNRVSKVIKIKEKRDE